MTWNYQIIKHTDETAGDWWGLHEVYKDEKGRPISYTVEPIVVATAIADENHTAIWSALRMMLRDAQTRKILNEKDFNVQTKEDL